MNGDAINGQNGLLKNTKKTKKSKERRSSSISSSPSPLFLRQDALREKVRNVGRILSLFAAMRKENEMMLKLGSLTPAGLARGAGDGGGGGEGGEAGGEEGVEEERDGIVASGRGRGAVERLLEGKERLKAVLEDKRKLAVEEVKEIDKIAEQKSFAAAAAARRSKAAAAAKSAAKDAAKDAAKSASKDAAKEAAKSPKSAKTSKTALH